MDWIAVALAFLGLVLLLVGFWKNSRGLLVIAGTVLFLAGSVGDFLDRWVTTAKQAEAEARALRADAPAAPGAGIGATDEAAPAAIEPVPPEAPAPAPAPASAPPR